MLYLEDYLEMIEHLPHELRDRFTEMREMDLQVHNEMDNLDEKVKLFFSNAKKMKSEQREMEFSKIKQEYMKTLEDAEEKVELANQIYELVEKYLKRLDSELQKFKIELEADNSGITEILERRSLELDNPSIPVINNLREKKKHSSNNDSSGKGERITATRESGNRDTSFCLSNNLNNNWISSGHYSSSLSSLSTCVTMSTNGNSSNPLLANTLSNSPHSPSLSVSTGNQIISPANLTHPSPLSYNLGAGNTAIAAAASQAIAATQQMQQGRRTASLKASYEAINAGLQNISCDFSAFREGSLSSPFTPQSGPFHGSEGSSSGIQKATKRTRTSSQFHDTDESSEAMPVDENGAPIDWTYDPNEPRYCLCNQVSYGDMVACDNSDCQYEWFHYGCVGISQPPRGKWFCPPCTLQMKKKNRKEK